MSYQHELKGGVPSSVDEIFFSSVDEICSRGTFLNLTVFLVMLIPLKADNLDDSPAGLWNYLGLTGSQSRLLLHVNKYKGGLKSKPCWSAPPIFMEVKTRGNACVQGPT